MKRLFLIFSLLLAGITHAAPPSLLIYMHPDEYAHEVNLGMKPYFSRWVARGPAVEAAARSALAKHFSSIDLCEGNRAADVIAAIRPSISYNPVPGRYSTKVSVRFYGGDGKLLGKLQAKGQHDAPINSVFFDDDVRHAFESAMQKIAEQFDQNKTLQEALQASLSSDPTHMPCTMVGMIPGK